jgi:hypothetical protein
MVAILPVIGTRWVSNHAKRSVLCAEFLELDGGRVTASTLVFDWRRWPEVLSEIRDRATRVG